MPPKYNLKYKSSAYKILDLTNWISDCTESSNSSASSNPQWGQFRIASYYKTYLKKKWYKAFKRPIGFRLLAKTSNFISALFNESLSLSYQLKEEK